MKNSGTSLYHVFQKDNLTNFFCYFIPFLGLGGYLLLLISGDLIGSVDGYYLIHYLYTYDHGFVSRGLVGEVISWFCDIVSDETTRFVLILFNFLLMLSAVLCIGKALTKVKNNPKLLFVVLSICIALCVLPASFQFYYRDVKLDKLLWAITLFSVSLVDKKYGIWLIPFLCITATLVNPIFLFCSMILIAVILLQEFYTNNFSKKHGTICFIAYFSMILLGIYALISEKYLGFETPRELVDYYFSRYSGVLTDEIYHSFDTKWIFDYFDTMDVIIKKSFQIYFVEWENWKVCLADFIFLMIPSYTVLGLFWKNCISESENKFQKFIFFLCLISPVVVILPIIFSWESSKYFYNNLFVHLSLMIYFIVSGNRSVINTINNTLTWIKNHIFLSLFIGSYFVTFIAV